MKLLSCSLPQILINDSLIKILGYPNRDSILPSMRLVLKDLLLAGQHNICNFITQSPETGVTGEDVLASFLLPFVLIDMDSPNTYMGPLTFQ